MYTKTLTLANGVKIPQLCIRYTLQLGAISLPKTANPAHMESNAQVDFEISEADKESLKHFKRIESYGESGVFPVYGAGCKRTKTDGSAVLFRSGVDGWNICVYTDCGIINKRMRRLFEGKDESL